MSDVQPGASLIDAIIAFLAGRDLLTLAEIRVALEREVDRAGPDALLELKARLAAPDTAWDYYPPDQLARRIHHVLADRLVDSASRLDGLDHVRAVTGRRVAILANHVSYADANLLEILLERAGASALADRLTAIAGPKIFSSRSRRFSSLCFGTIKVAQSADVASDDAVMSAREVARAARHAIDVARRRVELGDALLIFGEGTRSRSHGLQPMLPAVARYLDVPDLVVLPVGIVGTETLFPIGDEAVHPARVVVRIGPPIEVGALRADVGADRRAMMDRIGAAIARQLPAEFHGVYGPNAAEP